MIKRVERYTDVMFSFPAKLRYFAEVEAANGALFCAYDNGAPAGIICLKDQGNAFDTAYLYVNDEKRRQGFALRLTEYAACYARSLSKTMRFRVLENSEYSPALLKIAQSLNMKRGADMIFFKLEVNAQTRKLWQDYKPGLAARIARIEKRFGESRPVTFTEAGQDLLDRLKAEIGVELPWLDPFALPDLNPDFSIVVTHGDKITGFNAVRTIGRKMIYEISSATYGITLAAGVPVFFDKLFASDIEIVTCAVYGDNQAGLSHAQGQFGFLFKESGRQTVYIL